MDTYDFFNLYKIAPLPITASLCSACDICALKEVCGAYFNGCPAPVGYNFQKKGGNE